MLVSDSKRPLQLRIGYHMCAISHRIHFVTHQCCLQPDNIAPYVSSPAGRSSAQVFLSEALQLSEELFELRHVSHVAFLRSFVI